MTTLPTCHLWQARYDVQGLLERPFKRHPMINGKRVAVVMPAYNAESTLEATVHEIPDLVDTRILVDDYSKDQTVAVARRLGLTVFEHDRNLSLIHISEPTRPY